MDANAMVEYLFGQIQILKSENEALRRTAHEAMDESMKWQKKFMEIEDYNDELVERVKLVERKLLLATEELELTKETKDILGAALDDELDKTMGGIHPTFASMLASFQASVMNGSEGKFYSDNPELKDEGAKAEEELQKRIDEALDDHEGEGI